MRADNEVLTALAALRSDDYGDLPSREVLSQVTDHLIKALFPQRIGMCGPDVNGYVRRMLESALGSLSGEVGVELAFQRRAGGRNGADPDQIVALLAKELPTIRDLLDTDIEMAYRGDPAARSIAEVLVCYPGVHAMMHHRIAHQLHRLGVPFIARVIAELGRSETGIDIHPAAAIGGGFFIDHGTGVVVGETAIIGDRVRLYQHVTLGAKKLDGVPKGMPRHPIVEDDVTIYSGATVLGRITIGAGSVIGGGVWVTEDLPPGSFVTQARTQVDTFSDGAGI
ncbi:MAG TPA: serine acetyltransferase [Actinomycetota bacterium]|nr:serine acetyltransferase [Actinomycetota bacterium]